MPQATVKLYDSLTKTGTLLADDGTIAASYLDTVRAPGQVDVHLAAEGRADVGVRRADGGATLVRDHATSPYVGLTAV